MIDAIATVGDVADINCWSGTPWHFMQAAQAAGMKAAPWRLEMANFNHSRRVWNAHQWLLGRGLGGYQYSEAFLSRAEALIPDSAWVGTILSFNQHFPRSSSVYEKGGRLIHYIDATVASAVSEGGFASHLPERIKAEALALECKNFQESDWVVTMGRWAAESVINDCGVDPNKVRTILPGANLTLPGNFQFVDRKEVLGKDRPLVLGFIGKEWRRKGLPFLLEVRAILERMGVRAVVRCVGNYPSELAGTPGLEYLGFIDKAKSPIQFIEFLTSCDLGCLFSAREPLGISTLEFLRAGVPVAGFMTEGVADTVPPDAGFRFQANQSSEQVAVVLRESLSDNMYAKIDAAKKWSKHVTWERCVSEWNSLLNKKNFDVFVQPWKGLKNEVHN